MKVRTMIVGPIQACCYIVGFPPSKTERQRPVGVPAHQGRSPDLIGDAMVIDPGGDGDQIIQSLKRNKLTPIYIVNTHGHIDHIAANTEVKEAFPKAMLCIHPADAAMLGSANKNLSAEWGYNFTSPQADKLLNEGDVINLGGYHFKVLHIPGHTPGGIVLLYQSKNNTQPSAVFSGDTLFQMGIGRSDFPGGSHQDLIKGIKEKIFTLSDDTIVYPGHGPITTVGAEKKMNPFFS